MEYADSSLRNYLKENFKNLTLEHKYKLAYQLANAVSCLHEKGIVHCNLVIYKFIKLFDFDNLRFNYILFLYSIIAFRKCFSSSRYC